MGPALRVARPGLLTTVQDLGRPGHLGMALSQGGAMDPTGARLANLLVGNPEDAAVLECTGMGPTITVTHRTALAWTGADFALEIKTAQATGLRPASHRPIVVPAGAQLRWASPGRGFRAWLAFAGGLDSPTVLGSRSAHLAAALGPGRLTGGEMLHLGAGAAEQTDRIDSLLNSRDDMVCIPSWHIPMRGYEEGPVTHLYAFTGRHYRRLTGDQQERLWKTLFGVSPQSSRQGLRLEGPPLNDPAPAGISSEPVRFGTVQLPPEGIPYILLAEHQTTGGYPRVLEVCGSMGCVLAQAGPGSRIRFVPTSLQAAQERMRAEQARLDAIRMAIAAKLGL